MLRTYSRLLDILERIEKLILTVSVPVMVILMVYQVILRYIFSASNSWSEELIRYLFIFSTMIAASIAVRRNSHLQIDIFINRLSERLKKIFTIVSTLAGIVFLCMLFVYCLELCAHAAKNISPGVGISMAVPYACMPMGSVLMILTSVEVVLKNIDDLRHLKEAANS